MNNVSTPASCSIKQKLNLPQMNMVSSERFAVRESNITKSSRLIISSNSKNQQSQQNQQNSKYPSFGLVSERFIKKFNSLNYNNTSNSKKPLVSSTKSTYRKGSNSNNVELKHLKPSYKANYQKTKKCYDQCKIKIKSVNKNLEYIQNYYDTQRKFLLNFNKLLQENKLVSNFQVIR